MKIILNEQDIKAVLEDYVRREFGPLMDLTLLDTYTYSPTATFTRTEVKEEAEMADEARNAAQ